MIPAVLERCVGIDIGKKFVVACVITGAADAEPKSEIRQFGTAVGELEQLRDWLLQHGCTHAVMESTGSYWKPVYNILESHLRVILANAQQVKSLPGRKTDRKDGRRLAHLLRHGLITPSFIPPRDIRELRDLTRRRKRLLQAGSSERNRIQKVLEDANVKLASVLSDVFGVSGQDMLEALLAGRGSAAEIAQFARGQLRRKIPAIQAALQGHQMSEHHRFLIRQSLRHMEFLEEQIAELDGQVLEKLQPYEAQYALLQTIPGLKHEGAARVLAELGPDMRVFPSVSHAASWTGLAPGNNRSAGKQKSGRTTKGNRWLAGMLCQCAWAATHRNGSYFQAKYRRLLPRRGHQRALIAVAHSMLRVIYFVLRDGVPYREVGMTYLDERRRRQQIRYHRRRLQELEEAA